MEKIKKVFCSNFDGLYQSELQAYANYDNELYIEIKMENSDCGFEKQFICFNYDTAKAFINHLQDEFKLLEKEVKNGTKRTK